jgi:hypothetical protein
MAWPTTDHFVTLHEAQNPKTSRLGAKVAKEFN